MATRIPNPAPSPEDDDWTRHVDQDGLRARIQEALDDPRPPIPQSEVFARLREHHARRSKGT